MRSRDPRARAAAAFRDAFGGREERLARAPGRVNVLGGHVDYSEGWVLPGSIEPAVWVAARATSGEVLRALSIEVGGRAEIDVASPPPPLSERETEASWSDYLAGVVWALRERGLEVPGLEVAIASDLPIGAGVSSSAALEVALLTTIESMTGQRLEGVEKARIGREVENRYLGVQSGIMDQYASIHGEEGRLLLLDCRELSHEAVPLPGDARVLLVDTGVRRRLIGSGFNDRRAECEEAVRRLRAELPEIRTLRDVTPDQLEGLAHLLPSPLDLRARHAVEECARVRHGAEVLEAGRIEDLRELMAASHCSSRDLYEVSIPELDLLAETAWQVEGCWGARLAGGGFGGCVLALAHVDAVDELRRRLGAAFEAQFGRTPGWLETRVAGGACVATT